MTRRLLTHALLSGALFASTLFPMTGAQAQATHEVRVGALLSVPSGAESMRFFPSELRVHMGDTIHFSTQGMHTATFLPAGDNPDTWVAQNSTEVGAPYSPLLPDEDDGSGQMKFNPAVSGPSDASCGLPWLGPCDYSGTQVVNSGLPLFFDMDFAVNVSVSPGTTFWVVDLASPDLRMKVDVVPGAEVTSAPSEIDAARNRQIAADSERAQELHQKFSKPKKIKRKGKVFWKVFAGIEEPGLALRGFYPKKLKIKPKHHVRWIFKKLQSEGHAVAFPRAFAGTLNAGLPMIQCDLDENGAGPDQGQQSFGFPFCLDPAHLELDVPDTFLKRTGDAVLKGTDDFSSSGARGAGMFTERRPYNLKFPRRSDKKGFRYACAIHPFMRGKVVVR